MTLWIDRSINISKWPFACFALLLYPFLFESLPGILSRSMRQDFLFFWMGLVGYIFLWKFFFRSVGSFLPTLEHETTHAVFALLTGHRIVDFEVRWDSGGHVGYVGGVGNWLITLSPYFVPLLLLITIPSLSYFVEDARVQGLVLGMVFAFELISTWRQIHRNQPDLKKSGWFFCFVFLPPALLVVYGSVLYFLCTDMASLLLWYQEGIQSVGVLLKEVIDGYYSH